MAYLEGSQEMKACNRDQQRVDQNVCFKHEFCSIACSDPGIHLPRGASGQHQIARDQETGLESLSILLKPGRFVNMNSCIACGCSSKPTLLACCCIMNKLHAPTYMYIYIYYTYMHIYEPGAVLRNMQLLGQVKLTGLPCLCLQYSPSPHSSSLCPDSHRCAVGSVSNQQ